MGHAGHGIQPCLSPVDKTERLIQPERSITVDNVQSTSSANVLDQSAVFAIKKQRDITKDTINTLVESTVQQSRSVNPAHLGQNIDVRA